MSKQTINIGASPNDGTGTPLRTSFDYTNQNFTEIYTALGGGVALPGATTQVIFNDGGTNLAGDAGLVYNKTTDALTVAGLVTAGSATITGDLTVRTNKLAVTSTGVGIGTATPLYPLHLVGEFGLQEESAGNGSKLRFIGQASQYNFRLGKQLTATNAFEITPSTAPGGTTFSNPVYTVTYDGIHTFLDGAGGTRMTLNSTGLGVGMVPVALAGFGSTFRQKGVGAAGGIFTENSTTASWFGIYSGTSAADCAALIYPAGGTLRFATTTSVGTAGFTPLMTLDASGNLLVGTTSVLNGARVSVKTASVTSTLSLNGVTGDTAQESLVINKFDSDSTTSQVFARFTNNNGSGGSGQINGNGANACAFGSFSDARLKENIVSLTSQLANILSLRPVEFDYKDGSGHQIGFVAQEIQEVYSDTVAEQNGFLTVTGWSKTEARLVSAIKELAAKVQALEAKLA
jgi:hypothetical protein